MLEVCVLCLVWLAAAPAASLAEAPVLEKAHPRIFIQSVEEMKKRIAGPLADDYKVIKRSADAAVNAEGTRYYSRWYAPDDLMNCGLAWLVEKDRKYADAIIKRWGDGAVISNKRSSQFGYHAILYDWIYDALTPQQRVQYGDALGPWLRYYTDTPEIMLKSGHWEYNQTWGPIHFSVMNSRDAIAPKLMVALAIAGAGTAYEDDARAFIVSWRKRIPEECIPAFNRVGGVWSESYGHGAYGPVTVIPYAFRAWFTATGEDLLKQVKPWGWPVEAPRWIAYAMMPHNNRTAWIDDGDGSRPTAFAQAASMLHDGLSQWFSDCGRDWMSERWQRVTSYDPAVKPVKPDTLPLGYLFPGAGHVYMRSAWNDPNATWAFFGCGPQFAGHSRDDEGHFLIYKQGALVSRQGGQGHNDYDFYAGGSLIYNIVTVFDPSEQFRRSDKNENDGGLLRHVYELPPFPHERGKITAFGHTDAYTYAAADITKGYSDRKVREVTRQFLYLRGQREYFVIFDRVEATKAEFKRHFFLHVPTEPDVDGRVLAWNSLPEGDGDREVLSKGRARIVLHSLLPDKAEIVTRGGAGKEAWGHPLEPTAQYDHQTRGRSRPPICPWRIEIGDGGPGARTLYLNVMEVAQEGARPSADIKFVPPAGVDIGSKWQVRFNATGALGGTVGKTPLPTTMKTEGQYK
ncbi:MAG: hypothetical protein ACE15C_20975 [Phycisphaerae bacterium]